MENTCDNCKHRDGFGFCCILVVDTRRTVIENNKPVKAYYIAEAEEQESRNAFIVPKNFGCNKHDKKRP